MKALRAVIVGSFVLLLVSFWNRNVIPGRIEALPALADEPVQKAIRQDKFEVGFNGVSYQVRPQYRYELNGLVVSYRHHDGNSRMHRRSQDHLNMLDVCVVWGDNVDSALLRRLDFWNGIFTCNVSTRDQEAWERFDMVALSNNHLISDDPDIRKAVQKIRIGDQIRVRGLLSAYAAGEGPERGTSVTREDTGNGACETIYVDEFAVTRAAVNRWRITMWTSLVVLLIALGVYFSRPYRPHAAS